MGAEEEAGEGAEVVAEGATQVFWSCNIHSLQADCCDCYHSAGPLLAMCPRHSASSAFYNMQCHMNSIADL